MRLSRRSYLASAGAAGALGVAGCLGGSADVPEYDCGETGQPDIVSELPTPMIGDPDADVTVTAFEDFSCPACGTWKTDEFPAIREEYIETGRIRFEHWDFPVTSERWTYVIPNAARGVQDRQGDEAFFEFSRVAYEHQGSYSMDVVGYAAEEAGDEPCAAVSDAVATDDDGLAPPYQPVIEADFSEARDRGVTATPSVYVDGDSVDPTADAVSDAIEDAL